MTIPPFPDLSPSDAWGADLIAAIRARGNVLLENGAEVPPGTPPGAVVYEKGPETTTWDFRGASELPAGWARRGVASETFNADGMEATYTGGQGHYVDLPETDPDAMVEIKLHTGEHANKMGGPMLTTAAGAGACMFGYSSPADYLLGGVSSWTYSSSFQSAGGDVIYPSWLRVRCFGGSVYYGSYSLDGSTWSAETTGIAVAGPPTRISIGSILNSLTQRVAYVKYIPGGGGGLRGWWDGSEIVPF